MRMMLSILELNSDDWMMFGLLAFIFGGILLGFFFYLRTAYRAGGWKRVRRDFLVAIAAILAWVVSRLVRAWIHGS